jgi:hypothetical protein
MNAATKSSGLVEDIHDVALEPARWSDVVGCINEFVGGKACRVFSKDSISKFGVTHYYCGADPYYIQLFPWRARGQRFRTDTGRVARAVCHRQSRRCAGTSERLGVAETTVKTHLYRVFAKTRQADLLKLAAGFSNPLAN